MSTSSGLSRRSFLGAAALAPVAGLATATVATAGASSAASHLAAQYPTFNLRADFGAVGDGQTNDTAAFQAAAAAIIAAGGGTLIIPPATYIVGIQGVDNSPGTPYYPMQDIFFIPRTTPVQYLRIEGAGATMRLASGLRYGSFHPETGAVFDPPPGNFWDEAYAAEVRWMIGVEGSTNVTIDGLELDGNSANLVLGGRWGDTGRQMKGTGIRILRCSDVAISNMYTHHHALDGVTIGYGGLTSASPATPHTLSNVVSEYNGRQGLSWTGGRGLTCVNCSFNHTGRGAIRSAPAAGVDIEPESSVTLDGLFIGCDMINNAGWGLNAANDQFGEGGHSSFEDCTFWGTTTYSCYTNYPGMKFGECRFYGAANVGYGSSDASLAARYTDCVFEDRAWTNGQVYREGAAGVILSDSGNTGQNVAYTNCSFIARGGRGIYFTSNSAIKRLTDCEFLHGHAGVTADSYQSRVYGAVVAGCRFTEDMPAGTTTRWSILISGVTVTNGSDGRRTHVTGPTVRWGSVNGPVGDIPNT
ncbi:right-handed parallel beta-helix repeat-containing protein [Phytoactinopolyspora mesophila]|uniref:right-handed parallel beta-helix repeat-containing protein n=1 Tax=Phytoactinopolyspora mesophila TaxID=2650750 RepID=UPI001391055D|nr:hypothetical protein [Phytoactinopolyspora mesophila]